MTVVSRLMTGRMGFTVTFHRDTPAWDSTVTWAAPTGPHSWTLSRRAVLYLTAIERGESDETAALMAKSAMVLWANESGWGRHEYRWNGWGCHCYASGDCMHFESGDPELAAFSDLHASAGKFWGVALATTEVAALFRAGNPIAASRLVATSFGGGAVLPESDARSIWARIETYMNTPELDPGRPARASGRRSSGALKWIVAGIAAALLVGKGKS